MLFSTGIHVQTDVGLVRNASEWNGNYFPFCHIDFLIFVVVAPCPRLITIVLVDVVCLPLCGMHVAYQFHLFESIKFKKLPRQSRHFYAVARQRSRRSVSIIENVIFFVAMETI